MSLPFFVNIRICFPSFGSFIWVILGLQDTLQIKNTLPYELRVPQQYRVLALYFRTFCVVFVVGTFLYFHVFWHGVNLAIRWCSPWTHTHFPLFLFNFYFFLFPCLIGSRKYTGSPHVKPLSKLFGFYFETFIYLYLKKKTFYTNGFIIN